MTLQKTARCREYKGKEKKIRKRNNVRTKIKQK